MSGWHRSHTGPAANHHVVQGQNSLVTLAANAQSPRAEFQRDAQRRPGCRYPALSYQWTLNGNAVVDKRIHTDTEQSAKRQAGAYVLVADDAYGSAQPGKHADGGSGHSSVGRRAVQPLAVMQFVGQAFTLMVDAQGTEPSLSNGSLTGKSGRRRADHRAHQCVNRRRRPGERYRQLPGPRDQHLRGSPAALASVTVTPIASTAVRTGS